MLGNQPNGQAVPPAVPDYELLRRIGGGSYGEVWLAKNNATGALRAAKIVWRHTFEDERPYQREFEGIQRFEKMSREHPSQLALFHIGRNAAAGYFYYVMELADDANWKYGGRNGECGVNTTPQPGVPKAEIEATENYIPRTLRAELTHGRLPTAAVVGIGLALTEALEHLHAHGLVHRDVKPSNVIFVKGRPKLADIGLVTDSSDRCSIVGTEGYLPPEGPGTPQADMFALGKVLYEAALGLDRRQFPQLPEDLRTWPDANQVFELNEVLLRACQGDSGRRYESVGKMRAELELLQQGGSVKRFHQEALRWSWVRRGCLGLGTAALLGWALYAARPHWMRSATAPRTRRSTNQMANVMFDQGQIYLDKMSGTNFEAAAHFFEEAIKADTNFALAYAYLADTYGASDNEWNPSFVLLPKALEPARKALALDPSLPTPHGVLGWYKTLFEWDWKGAKHEYLEALRLEPRNAACHGSYAEYLKIIGQAEKGLAELKTADDLYQNKFPWIKHRLVAHLIAARDFKGAVEQAKQAIAVEPTRLGHYAFRSRALCAQGRYREALDSDREMRLVSGEPPAEVEKGITALKKALEAEGPKVYWARELEQIKRNDSGPYFEALAYAQMGETDQAILRLQKAFQERNLWLTFRVMTDWELDPVRQDSRFREILRAMRLN